MTAWTDSGGRARDRQLRAGGDVAHGRAVVAVLGEGTSAAASGTEATAVRTPASGRAPGHHRAAGRCRRRSVRRAEAAHGRRAKRTAGCPAPDAVVGRGDIGFGRLVVRPGRRLHSKRGQTPRRGHPTRRQRRREQLRREHQPSLATVVVDDPHDGLDRPAGSGADVGATAEGITGGTTDLVDDTVRPRRRGRRPNRSSRRSSARSASPLGTRRAR